MRGKQNCTDIKNESIRFDEICGVEKKHGFCLVYTGTLVNCRMYL